MLSGEHSLHEAQKVDVRNKQSNDKIKQKLHICNDWSMNNEDLQQRTASEWSAEKILWVVKAMARGVAVLNQF